MQRLDDEPGRGAEDVVESAPPLLASARDRWARLTLRQRLPVLLAAAGLMVAALVAYVLMEARQWRAERAAADEVTLSAAMGVVVSSMAPSGGRLDFYVAVRNAGPGPVTVTGVDVIEPGLRVSSASGALSVRPGESVSLPLSVLLDCSAWSGAAGSPGRVGGAIAAAPASGRLRMVATTFEAWGEVVGIADGVCAAHPDTVDLELDGPVLRQVRTG